MANFRGLPEHMVAPCNLDRNFAVWLSQASLLLQCLLPDNMLPAELFEGDWLCPSQYARALSKKLLDIHP